MKNTNKPRYLSIALLVTFFVAAFWSCKNDDPTLAELRDDKLTYLADSLRISDSLKRINSAGAVNYAITVLSGSTSTIFNNYDGVGRTQGTKAVVSDAIVTLSQFGKILKDTTDASGMVVFNGFFRSAVNVTVEKAGFTTMSYIAAVSITDSTANNSISFVGNIIPIFETTGANTATISGRATIQTDLTNRTRELAPDGTTVRASIDATTNNDFADRFLTFDLANFQNYTTTNLDILYVGEIMQAAYGTGIVGTVTGGNYTITVPAAIDGLPLVLDYSDVAADQKLFESGGVLPGDRTATYRTIFSPDGNASSIPAASGVAVGFIYNDIAASATAVISANTGTLDKINVTNGGTGYNTASPPPVEIVGGGGTGAAATAVVGANGRVTAINITNAGSGYTAPPTINIISGGTSATAASVLDGTLQQVFSISVTNQGSGYTSAPTVGFTGGGGSGAAATAQVANGRVVAVIVTATGSAFTGTPTVTFTGGGGAAAAATAVMGSPVLQVNMTLNGSNYTSTPVVTFDAPFYSNGTRAQGQAVIDPATRTVLGVLVTNPGSGYTSNPGVTINGGSGATAQVFITGGSVISANITAQGAGYVGAPTITFTGGGGTGAAATPIMVDGKVTGLTITNGGTGYTTPPSITFASGDGANAFATITNGVITGVTVSDGGRLFLGAPRVTFTSLVGGGATATSTVANGQVTGITLVAGGSGYLDGNIPANAESFGATKGTYIETKTGLKYINDVHYGTGERQPN